MSGFFHVQSAYFMRGPMPSFQERESQHSTGQHHGRLGPNPSPSAYWLCALWKEVDLSVQHCPIWTRGRMTVPSSLGCGEHEMNEEPQLPTAVAQLEESSKQSR